MNRKLSIASIALTSLTLSFALVGCDRGKPSSFDAKPSSSTSDARPSKSVSNPKKTDASGEATSASPTTTKLAGLNLEVTTTSTRPASITESKLLGTMISAGPVTVSVAKAKPTQPSTIEAEKKAAASYSPKNLTSETLPDGWYVTYDNQGSMGANYFLTVYRKIGGEAYRCTTTSANEAARSAALEICKSLKQ